MFEIERVRQRKGHKLKINTGKSKVNKEAKDSRRSICNGKFKGG